MYMYIYIYIYIYMYVYKLGGLPDKLRVFPSDESYKIETALSRDRWLVWPHCDSFSMYNVHVYTCCVQEDLDGHLSALHILQDLLSKNAAAFEDQFARLGLQLKIHALAGPPTTTDEPLEEMEVTAAGGEEKEAEGTAEKKEKKEEEVGEGGAGAGAGVEEEGEGKIEGGEGGKEAGMDLEDATEVAVFSPYQWREWSIVRSQDCLYLWNEFSSLELSNVSNGWFRFLIDNKLATMYSSGSTEGGPDSFGEELCLTMYMYMRQLIFLQR